MAKKGESVFEPKKEHFELQFYFPQVARPVESVEQLKIEPLWEFAGDKHIVGLYRIAMQVKFLSEHVVVAESEQAIAIDHVDIDGQQRGYFEYALPFETFFEKQPKDLQLQLEQVKATITGGQICHVKWQSATIIQLEEPPHVVEIVEEEPVIEVASIESEAEKVRAAVKVKQSEKKEANLFMNDLVEQYSIWRSNDFRPK